MEKAHATGAEAEEVAAAAAAGTAERRTAWQRMGRARRLVMAIAVKTADNGMGFGNAP